MRRVILIGIRSITMLPVWVLFVSADYTAKKLDTLFDWLDEKLR